MTNHIFGGEKKGSITDIPLPHSRNQSKEPLDLSRSQSQGAQVERHDVSNWNTMKGKNKRKGLKAGLITLVIIVGLFVLSLFLHSAEITITVKQSSVPLVETYNATLDGSDDSIAFTRPEPLSKTNTFFIKGTTEENIQSKASGTITLTHSGSTPQRFRATTRFVTPDGRLYRAPRSIPIPANGSVEVEVVADQPGESYNAEGGLTFTLPGLDGTALASQITVVQNSPITGGFSGVVTSATDDDIQAGKNTLEKELNEQLRAQLDSQTPEGFMIVPGLVEVSDVRYKEIPNIEQGGIDLEGTASIFAVIFDVDNFDSFVATSVLKDYTPDQSISIQNREVLTFTIEDNDFDIESGTEFEFSLRSQGDATFVWNVDENDIKAAVAGRSGKAITPTMITELRGVQNVEVDISPFWRSKVPDNIKKIDVIITE